VKKMTKYHRSGTKKIQNFRFFMISSKVAKDIE